MKKTKIILTLVMLFLVVVVLLSACSKKSFDIGADARTVYDIAAVFDPEAKTLKCSQEVVYINRTGGHLSEVCFNLPQNAFRKDAAYPAVSPKYKKASYYNGESYGGVEFSSVSVGSKAADYKIGGADQNTLTVTLPSLLKNNAEVYINMEYTVTLPECAARMGITKTTVNLGNFYPIAAVFESGRFVCEPYYSFGDPFFSECADYYLTLTFPEEYQAAHSGREASGYFENGLRTLEIEAKSHRDVAVVLSKNFKSASDRINGIDVNYFYLDDEAHKTTLKTAVSAISAFSEAFGEYPFDSFTFAETELYAGGMEYGSMAYIADSLSGEAQTQTLVHEVAHQWWYIGVGTNQIAEAWLDEGLSDFSVALYFKRSGAAQTYERMMDAALSSYNVYMAALAPAKSDMKRPLGEFISEGEYIMICYMKSALMFQSVYEIVGEKQFLNALSDFYRDNKFKTATSADLMKCFDSRCRGAAAPIFNAFIKGYVVLGAAAPIVGERRPHGKAVELEFPFLTQ
jgi:hypothetical protein